MDIASFKVQNFKSIKNSGSVQIESFNTFIGKNDAGKSSFLEALTLFLKKEKPNPDHFHKSKDVKIIFEAVITDYEDIIDNLSEDLIDEKLILRRSFEPNDGRAPKSEVFINGEKVSKGAVEVNEEELTKAKSRDFLWDNLPKAIFVPAERDVSEQTKLKGGTFLNDLLVPILENGGIEDKNEILDAKETLEEELEETSNNLGKMLGQNMQHHMSDIEGVEVDTGSISIKKAISPKIKLKDKYLPDSVDIGERGSGVGSLFILSLMQTYVDMQLGEGYYLLFEEPGNWLHPGAERNMAGVLRQISEEGSNVLISTHSQVFINQKDKDNMYIVRRNNGESDYSRIDEEAFEAIEEIGAKNSDLLQSDYVIYVEGPSDKKILEEISKNIGGWSSKNITIQHLGGLGNIAYCDPKELQQINRRFAVILDSDRTNKEDNPSEDALEFKQQCDKIGVECKILQYRSIENYFSREAIKSVFNFEDLDEDFVGKYDRIPEKIKQKIGSDLIEAPNIQKGDYNKVNHGRSIVREMYANNSSIEEIEKFMEECMERSN